MKKLISLLLILTFSWASFAQEEPTSRDFEAYKALVKQDAEEFKVEFKQALKSDNGTKAAVEKVVYDLENLEKDLQPDLMAMSTAAANGLTVEVIAEIQRRFSAATALMTLVMVDKNMSLDKKKEYLNTLSASLRVVMFKVMREQGVDEVNTTKEFKRSFFANLLNEFFSDATALVTARASVKALELDANGKEVNSGAGPRVWTPVDRIRRNDLTIDLVQELQKSLAVTLDTLDSENIVEDKFIPTFWGEKTVPLFVSLRSQRLNSQKVATATYAGLAVWALLAPTVDVIGMIDGESENSLFASSMMYFSAWTAITMAKASTISATSLNEMKNLLAIAKKQGAKPSAERRNGFWRKLGVNLSNTAKSCTGFLRKE